MLRFLYEANKKSFIIDWSGDFPSKSNYKGLNIWTRIHEKLHLSNGFHPLA